MIDIDFGRLSRMLLKTEAGPRVPRIDQRYQYAYSGRCAWRIVHQDKG